MAVTAVRLFEVQGGINGNSSRNYDVTYHVDTDDKNDGPVTARNASGIPDRGVTFAFGNDTDVGATLKAKDAKLLTTDEHRRTWVVTCHYDTASSSSSLEDEDVGDPIDFATKWSGSFVQFQRDFLRDKDDASIKNSAGDPFLDPPITGDDSRLSIIAVKNFSSLNIPVWASFRDAVNDGLYWGLAARKIKVQSITWDQQFHEDVPFYTVRFEFHINDDTWDQEILDAGFYQKVNNDRERIPEAKGRDVNSPVPLTTAGAVMATTDIAAGNENYKTFKIYNEKDFSLLGLPSQVGDA